MYCFTKARRLLKKIDYDYVFTNANKTITPEFVVLHRANSLGYARIGLALSKKKIAKAHQRNRAKRLIRESFRKQNLPAVDIVILARQHIALVENNIITANLGTAWDKLTAFYAS